MDSANRPHISQHDRDATMFSLVAREVASATKLTELYNAVCQIVVGYGGYCVVWIGLAEYNPEQSVIPVAKAGYTDGFLETITASWSERENGLGPTGTAIREGTVQVCNDIENAPNVRLWRAKMLKRGYLASASLPLTCESGTFGALIIYAMEKDAFGPEEIEALARVAGLLSEKVCAMRHEATQTLIREG